MELIDIFISWIGELAVKGCIVLSVNKAKLISSVSHHQWTNQNFCRHLVSHDIQICKFSAETNTPRSNNHGLRILTTFSH